jgi:hypothetical protein
MPEADVVAVAIPQVGNKRVSDVDATRMNRQIAGFRDRHHIVVLVDDIVPEIDFRFVVNDRVTDYVILINLVIGTHTVPVDRHAAVVHAMRPPVRGVVPEAVGQELDDRPSRPVRIHFAVQGDLVFLGVHVGYSSGIIASAPSANTRGTDILINTNHFHRMRPPFHLDRR